MQLLILENNLLLEDLLNNQIDSEKNFNLFFCSKIKEIDRILKNKKFDFVIASSLLPKLNSYSVVETIFNLSSSQKIIQIVEKKNDKKNIKSKYCFVKPIKINEVLLVINKSLIKQKSYQKKSYFFKNGIIFKNKIRQLSFKNNKKEVRLTEKENEILHYLIKKRKFISKESLLKKVWGFNEKVQTRTLETHIYRLRKKVEKKFGVKRFIISNQNSYKIL